MFAIVETGGKQYKVQPGTVLHVEKLVADEGDQVILDHVLLVDRDGQLELGTPYLDRAEVVTKVRKQAKAKKVIIYKFKAKKNYRRKKGHRQFFTELVVEQILCPGVGEAAAAEG